MSQKSFHQAVAERLIEQLKAGTAPWQKPWSNSNEDVLPVNGITGKKYKGINRLFLLSKDRGDQRWMTYKQAHWCSTGNLQRKLTKWMKMEDQ